MKKSILVFLLGILIILYPVESFSADFTFLDIRQEESNLETHISKNLAFIQLLKNENYTKAEAEFSPLLRTQLNATQLKQVWTMLLSKYGTFQAAGKSMLKKTSEKSAILTSIHFEKESFDLSTSLDSEGFINSLNILPFTHKDLWEFPLYGQKRNTKAKAITIGETDPLMAELVEPKKNTKKAIAVFVHGSGPNDMDESLGPNKFFKDLAYGLANRGIASIRYNKRTYDYQTKMAKIQFEIDIDMEVTQDAVLAIQHAKTLGYEQVILIGHSLGGHMAPKIAELEKVNGVVVLAGNSSPLVDLLVPQFEYLLKHDSTSGITEFQLNAIKAQVNKVQNRDFDKETHPMMLPLSMSGIYWKSLEGYDPVKIASKQKQAYLILNGTRDYQVNVDEAKAWRNGSNNEQSKTSLFDGLNHLFYGGQGICLPSEYETKGHVDITVIEEISNWIKGLN